MGASEKVGLRRGLTPVERERHARQRCPENGDGGQDDGRVPEIAHPAARMGSAGTTDAPRGRRAGAGVLPRASRRGPAVPARRCHLSHMGRASCPLHRFRLGFSSHRRTRRRGGELGDALPPAVRLVEIRGRASRFSGALLAAPGVGDGDHPHPGAPGHRFRGGIKMVAHVMENQVGACRAFGKLGFPRRRCCASTLRTCTG